MPLAYLLDIEGTTTPIDFVTKTLFPYARSRMASYIDSGGVLPSERDQLLEEAGTSDLLQAIFNLMDADIKSTPLKAIQGRIWKAGYEEGELKGVVYPDVIPAIRKWRAAGLDVAIYSSGSVLAQKLIFGHLPEGDLCPAIAGFFDTNIGGKKSAESYHKIAESLAHPVPEVMFLSDAVTEISAAHDAGMQVRLVWRPEDGQPRPNKTGFEVISSFAEVS